MYLLYLLVCVGHIQYLDSAEIVHAYVPTTSRSCVIDDHVYVVSCAPYGVCGGLPSHFQNKF